MTQTYTYDELNRLATARENTGTSWKQKFLYDRYGNRRIDPSPTETSPDLVGPNPVFAAANNRIVAQAGEQYQYDSVGNLTRDREGQTYVFDAENKLISFNGGASQDGADYRYDGAGQRVKKVAGAVTTIFVYDVVGQLIAEYSSAAPQPNGTRYLTSDHLGSPRVVTGSNGMVQARHDYHPFGEEVGLRGGRSVQNGYVADNLRQQFTLKERDNETGLDYLINRYYSSTQGRFTSVDPDNAGSYSGNPQTWNGYSYALNQPMLYSDPDGLAVKVCGTDGQCTDKDTHLSDEQFKERFERNKNIKLKDGKVFQNGEQIGTYQRLSCDECLYDIHAIARGVEAADPGRRAVQVWGASVIAGLTIPSSAAGYAAIGVFTVLVPPDGGEEDAVAGTTLETDRRHAVDQAWKQEAELVRRTGRGTRAWTPDELRELRNTGKVSGYQGHHINSVKGNEGNRELIRDPRNIKFVKGGKAGHLGEHSGNYRNPTKGRLITRIR